MDLPPNGTQPRMDLTPNGTQPRMDLTPNGTQPRMDLTLNGTQPRIPLNLERDLFFSLILMKTYFLREGILSTTNGTISVAVKHIFIVSNFFNIELNSNVEALITFFV